MSHDPGDEDDIATSPHRFWLWPTNGATKSYCASSLTHERVPLAEHDHGDEDWSTWWIPLSDISARRFYKELFG